MLKTLDEKLDEGFMDRADKLTEDVQEVISAETVRDAFHGMEAIHKKYFPDGEYWISLSSLGRPSIYTSSTVHKRGTWSGNIARNDPMLTNFSITYKGNGKYVAELVQGDGLSTVPEPGSFLAIKLVRVPFRKYTGTPEQIMKKFEDWEKKRKETYEEHKDNLYSV